MSPAMLHIVITSLCVWAGYSTNQDEYLLRISKPRIFRPFGELLHMYSRGDVRYEVYKVIGTYMLR